MTEDDVILQASGGKLAVLLEAKTVCMERADCL